MKYAHRRIWENLTEGISPDVAKLCENSRFDIRQQSHLHKNNTIIKIDVY